MAIIKKGSKEWKEKNFEACKQDIIAAGKNPFIKDAAVIQKICYERGVDVGVGLDMYINDKGIDRKTVDAGDIKEYKELCRKYYLDFVVEVQKSM